MWKTESCSALSANSAVRRRVPIKRCKCRRRWRRLKPLLVTVTQCQHRATCSFRRAILQGCRWVLSPTRKETSYSDRRFWFSYILFIIIVGGILVLYIYMYIYIHIYIQGADKSLAQPEMKQATATEDWVSCILSIIIVGGIFVLYVYIYICIYIQGCW